MKIDEEIVALRDLPPKKKWSVYRKIMKSGSSSTIDFLKTVMEKFAMSSNKTDIKIAYDFYKRTGYKFTFIGYLLGTNENIPSSIMDDLVSLNDIVIKVAVSKNVAITDSVIKKLLETRNRIIMTHLLNNPSYTVERFNKFFNYYLDAASGPSCESFIKEIISYAKKHKLPTVELLFRSKLGA